MGYAQIKGQSFNSSRWENRLGLRNQRNDRVVTTAVRDSTIKRSFAS
jgi:hypothetical protein